MLNSYEVSQTLAAKLTGKRWLKAVGIGWGIASPPLPGIGATPFLVVYASEVGKAKKAVCSMLDDYGMFGDHPVAVRQWES